MYVQSVLKAFFFVSVIAHYQTKYFKILNVISLSGDFSGHYLPKKSSLLNVEHLVKSIQYVAFKCSKLELLA